MSTNTNKYATNIHSRDFIVLPVTALDTKVTTSFFEYSVDEVTVDNYTINEYVVADGRKLLYTTDGLYCYLGLNLSDLKNEKKDFKNFMKTASLVLGGTDFTVMLGTELWVLTPDELDEWLVTSPHNIPEEVVV